MQGACLCGAVQIEAATFTPKLSACHCDMCRRWSGSVLFGFAAPADAVTVEGPARLYPSSSFADRAWCGECGTHLWLRDHDGDYEFLPGLFDDARSFPLVREVYADRAFAGCRLAGEHQRVTRAEYEADHPFVEGDAR